MMQQESPIPSVPPHPLKKTHTQKKQRITKARDSNYKSDSSE